MNNQALVVGSIKDVADKTKKPISEVFSNVKMAIFLDVSESMDYQDCYNGATRISVATKHLTDLQNSNHGDVALICWNNKVEFRPNGIPTSPDGTTILKNALSYAKMVDGTSIKIVFISDGEPLDVEESIALAKTFKSKIHTIYVGPEGGKGHKVMKRLAEMSGGTSITNNLSSLHTDLGKSMTKLLTA